MLLHGFGVDHRILLPLDPAFEQAGGWRRIYLDLPGATGSPNGQVGSAQEVADAVVAEIAARFGSASFAILGNSFGGMIARHVAHTMRDQVLGLATLAGVFVPEHGQRTVPARSIVHEDSEAVAVVGDAAADYTEMAVVQTVDTAHAFTDFVLPGLAGADQAALERISSQYALARMPEEHDGGPFTQPALHITGRQDQVVGYHDAWARIEHYPRATFATLDGAGHNVHLEQSSICSALITDWLGRIRMAA